MIIRLGKLRWQTFLAPLTAPWVGGESEYFSSSRSMESEVRGAKFKNRGQLQCRDYRRKRRRNPIDEFERW